MFKIGDRVRVDIPDPENAEHQGKQGVIRFDLDGDESFWGVVLDDGSGAIDAYTDELDLTEQQTASQQNVASDAPGA